MTAMLRALLHQLVRKDDTLVDLLHQKCSAMSDSEINHVPFLKDLVKECLLTPRGGIIVLDGLDERQDGDVFDSKGPDSIIDWVHNSLIPESRAQGYSIRCLLSSQHVHFLDKQLPKHSNIRLEQEDGHNGNIHSYVRSMASQVQARFSLTDCTRQEVEDKVFNTAKGKHQGSIGIFKRQLT